jgi:hypothetical protein
MIAHARRTEGIDTTNRWVETRRSLPGDRMIRIAATSRRPSGGLIVGCLYLPNGNPAPGPKFDYKLRLFERLTGYSKSFGQRRAGSDLVRNRKFASIPLDRRVCEPSVPREVSRAASSSRGAAGSGLHRAVRTAGWVRGSIIDRLVAVPKVARLAISIPGGSVSTVPVSRVPVWSRASRQARH